MDIETVYVKAYMSNGYCGCDEEYVMAIEIPPLMQERYKLDYVYGAILDNYSYVEGFCGIENFIEDAEELGYDDLDEWYSECLKDNCCYDTISKEEFDRIVEEGEIEVR